MPLSLYVRRGPQSGTVFPVYDAAVTLVGRSRSNHAVLSDHAVSSSHCLLVPARGGEGCLLIDARSRGGIAVNGRPFTKGHVTLGDALAVGPFELELIEAEHPVARPHPPRPTTGGEARFQFGRPKRQQFMSLPPGSATVVGRGEHAHIRVEHHLVSEYHCLIVLDPDDPRAMPVLIDLHSANGTYVHRRAVHRKHILPGDPVIIGRTTFEIRRIEAQRPAQRPRTRRKASRPEPVVAPRAPSVSAPEPPLPAPPAPEPSAAVPAPVEQTPRKAAMGERLAFLAGLPPTEAADRGPLTPPPAWRAAGTAEAARSEAVEADPLPGPAFEEAVAAPSPSVDGVPSDGEGVEAPGECAVPASDADMASTPVVGPLPPPAPPPLAGRSATDRRLAEKPEGFRAHFGLREEPFAHDHDPRFFYYSGCHWEAFTTLNRWVETGPPLAVLFGEHGSGKTFVTACLARRLGLISPRTVLVWPDRETARRNDLILEAVLAAEEKYGGAHFGGSTPLDAWHALLGEVRRRDALFVFLIDDAHVLSRDNLRRLTDLVEHPELRDAVRILLTGEEQLRDVVAAPPLADHLGVTCYLAPMAAADVAAYVVHRLRLAFDDDERPLFTPRALQLLTTYSGGIPRLINNVADAALSYAFLQGEHEVTPALLADAIAALLRSETVAAQV